MTSTAEKRRIRQFVVGCTIVATVGAYSIGWQVTHQDKPLGGESPDWTVAPCSLWDGGGSPELPAYTMTDRCVENDGTVRIDDTLTSTEDFGQ